MNTNIVPPAHYRAASSPVPPALTRVRSQRSVEEELFDETFGLRRRAVYIKARCVVDAAAEVDVSVWEAIQSGERSLDRLWDVARAAAVRQRRWEQRQRRNDALRVDPSDPIVVRQFADEVAFTVTRRCDTTRAIANVAAAGFPAGKDALAWASRVAGVSEGDRLPSRVKMAGKRWAAKVREQLEVCDAA